MVRADGVQHLGVLTQAARQVDADLDVVAVAVRLDALADVVQQGRALGKLHVAAHLGGDHARDEGDLLRVREHVLPVAGAVMQAPEGPDGLGAHRMDAHLEEHTLAFLVDGLRDLLGDLLDDLLDARRVDPAVGDQAAERRLGDLPADRDRSTK